MRSDDRGPVSGLRIDCGKRVSALDLLLRLLARTLLEVAGEGTDHALLTQTDDGGVRAPRAGSREVGSGAAHPTECRWWLGRPAQCRTDDCRDPPSRSTNQSRASSPPRAAVEHVLGMVNRCSTTILAWFLAEHLVDAGEQPEITLRRDELDRTDEQRARNTSGRTQNSSPRSDPGSSSAPRRTRRANRAPVSAPRSGWLPGQAPGDLAQGNAHNRQRVDVPMVAVSGCRIPSAWKTSVNGTAVTSGGVGTEIARDVVDRELERLLGHATVDLGHSRVGAAVRSAPMLCRSARPCPPPGHDRRPEVRPLQDTP